MDFNTNINLFLAQILTVSTSEHGLDHFTCGDRFVTNDDSYYIKYREYLLDLTSSVI